MLATEPTCEGARSVLDLITGETLLRPSERDQPEQYVSLLRPDHIQAALLEAQLLRSTETEDYEG